MSEPKLTTRMGMHMQGGGFSIITKEILADGEPTGMTLNTHTDGSPKYNLVRREIHAGDESIDLMAQDHEDAVTWIRARLVQMEATDG